MHLALVAPALAGHLNPLTTVARVLVGRGHKVTLFGLPPAEPYAQRAGLNYHPIGSADYETAIGSGQSKLAELTGLRALKLTGHLLCEIEKIGLRDLPNAFRESKVEGVIVDQVSPAGGCAADALGLPFVMACNALALHQEPRVPPPVLGWPYREGFRARIRNRLGNRLLRFAARPIEREVSAFRSANNLRPLKSSVTGDIGLAQIAQQPALFDFPRTRLPDHFHYTAPWHIHGRDQAVTFPWDKLDGRPLIYASLGTLQNKLGAVYRAIVEGCSKLDVQLVLALGKAGAVWDGPTPSNAIVVDYAPQLALLDRASALITHAGLNTALEGLARGLPMVCLPVTNDQPGVAARVAYLGAGLVLKPKKATAARIEALVTRVMREPEFRETAKRCQAELSKLPPGAEMAAALIEQAFHTGQRVRRCEGAPTFPIDTTGTNSPAGSSSHRSDRTSFD